MTYVLRHGKVGLLANYSSEFGRVFLLDVFQIYISATKKRASGWLYFSGPMAKSID